MSKPIDFDWQREKFRYVFHGGPLDGKVRYVEMCGTHYSICMKSTKSGCDPRWPFVTHSYAYGETAGKCTIHMEYVKHA